jgi:hypothetical protein
MSKGITEKEPDPRIVYADIINLPYHKSDKYPHMSLYDRSAQFSSYKALSGYEDMVAEEARIVGERIVLEGHELDLLNQKLELIADVIRDGHIPELSITYFVPDEKKEGGKYVTVTGKIKKVDSAFGQIHLDSGNRKVSGRKIDIDKILTITGDLVDYLDDCE